MRKKKIIISNQNELQELFKDKTLKIKKNSKISFFKPLYLNSNIVFEGNIELGQNNRIDSNCVLKNIKFGNDNLIKMSSLIENSHLKNYNIVGPFAYIRDKTQIHNSCIVGAYVEVTRSRIKSNTKISHRAFVGDAKIEAGTIIGAGVVFCNYNFKTKSKANSVIGSHCKIGSNSTLIAPIKVKNNTIIPAASKYKN